MKPSQLDEAYYSDLHLKIRKNFLSNRKIFAILEFPKFEKNATFPEDSAS